jgi:hypothetical protein
LLEQSFMSSLIKADGSLLPFFSRPIAGVLGLITLAVWGAILLSGLRNLLRTERAATP